MVSTNSINRNHKQLLPILQKQKNTDISYYNNGDEDEEQENKSSDNDADDEDGRKNNNEEDDIENYDTDDDDNNNNQQQRTKQRGVVEQSDGCHTYSGGSKGQGSKSGSGISCKKARLVLGLDEIHSNRMVSSATCHQEEVSESITMSTATMRKDAYVEWRNAQGQMVSFSTVERSVRKYARDTLFSKVKFITLDSQLEYTGKCVRHCKGCLPSYYSSNYLFFFRLTWNRNKVHCSCGMSIDWPRKKQMGPLPGYSS